MLKSTGIVKKIDELGRIVIPKELRRAFAIEEGDSLEIFVDGERVILRKYQPGCQFCGGFEELIVHEGKNVCRHCLKEMVQKAKRSA